MSNYTYCVELGMCLVHVLWIIAYIVITFHIERSSKIKKRHIKNDLIDVPLKIFTSCSYILRSWIRCKQETKSFKKFNLHFHFWGEPLGNLEA
jgi:hypothetical protein